MSAFDHLGESGDDVFRGDRFRGGRGGAGVANVVDAFENHEVFHARLREHVGIEAGKRVDAELRTFGGRAFVENAVAADTHVHDGEFGTGFAQARGEGIGPAVIGVHCGARAVGDGVAKRHDRAGGGRGEDIHAGQKGPGGDRLRIVQRGGVRYVAGGEPGGLLGRGMEARAEDVAGQVEADGQVGGGGHGELDGIAEDDGAGGDLHARPAAEGKGLVRRCDDGRARFAEGEMRGADVHGLGTEGVGEPHAHGVAADADVDDFAQGLVVEADVGLRRGGGGPGADPMCLRAEREGQRGCEKNCFHGDSF